MLVASGSEVTGITQPLLEKLALLLIVFGCLADSLTHPPEVGSPIGVRRLLDQLVDALKVVGHRHAFLDVRHLGGRMCRVGDLVPMRTG